MLKVLSLVCGLILNAGWVFAQTVEPQLSEQEKCIRNLPGQVAQSVKGLQSYYDSIDKVDGEIRANNGSHIQIGTKSQAILLMHGFAASPFEVAFLGDALHRKGYTVLMPLLFGFGASPKVANAMTKEQWKRWYKFNVNLLARCYKEIYIGGFSTGGSLTTDFIFNEIQMNGKYEPEDIPEMKTTIKGAMLFSPYYESTSKVSDFLDQSIGLVADSVSFNGLWIFTGQPDLAAIVNNLSFYNDRLPLDAGLQVVHLGREIQARYTSWASELPVFLAYSEADKTASPKATHQFAKDHFLNLTEVAIPKSEKVPHQITVPFSNMHYFDILQRAVDFLKKTSGENEEAEF